jgi:hypothetical protein
MYYYLIKVLLPMPKKTAAKKTVSKKAHTPIHKRQYLVKEQDHFHKNHPNAQMLLTVFIGAVVVLFALYLSRNGMSQMGY